MPRRYRTSYSPGPRGPRNPNKQLVSAIVLVVVLSIAAYKEYEKYHHAVVVSHAPPTSNAVVTSTSNWLLGNPSNAGTDANNYLLIKPYFVVSYNNQNGEPNWVSWRLTKDNLGDAPRRNKFSTDTTLPEFFHLVSEKDYSNSGFDRGHMCPHGDRTKNQEMSYATFVMSNVVPQTHQLNEMAWNMLELYCRQIAKKENARLYITAGPAGSGGQGSFGFRKSFANNTVVVPSECWKVIVIVPDDGTEDLTDITPATRVIAVVMPNTDKIGYEWQQFRVSPADVETLTGYHFFTALPADVAAALRKKIDREYIEPQERPEHF